MTEQIGGGGTGQESEEVARKVQEYFGPYADARQAESDYYYHLLAMLGDVMRENAEISRLANENREPFEGFWD